MPSPLRSVALASAVGNPVPLIVVLGSVESLRSAVAVASAVLPVEVDGELGFEALLHVRVRNVARRCQPCDILSFHGLFSLRGPLSTAAPKNRGRPSRHREDAPLCPALAGAKVAPGTAEAGLACRIPPSVGFASEDTSPRKSLSGVEGRVRVGLPLPFRGPPWGF